MVYRGLTGGETARSPFAVASDRAYRGLTGVEAARSPFAVTSDRAYRVVTSTPSSVTMTVCSFWLTNFPSCSFSTG